MSPEDGVLLRFLEFIARDILRNPDRLEPISEMRIEQARALTRSVTVRADELLPEDITF